MKRRARGKGEGTNEVDVLVGQRLRELRMLAGLSQSDLAATIGLTFQQLQKYERGVNRISASKLYLLARFLSVPVSALFADVDGRKHSESEPVNSATVATDAAAEPQLRSREGLVLARYFMRIRDQSARDAIKAFAEACAGMTSDEFAPAALSVGHECAGFEAGNDNINGAKRSRRPRGVVWHPTDIAST